MRSVATPCTTASRSRVGPTVILPKCWPLLCPWATRIGAVMPALARRSGGGSVASVDHHQPSVTAQLLSSPALGEAIAQLRLGYPRFSAAVAACGGDCLVRMTKGWPCALFWAMPRSLRHSGGPLLGGGTGSAILHAERCLARGCVALRRAEGPRRGPRRILVSSTNQETHVSFWKSAAAKCRTLLTSCGFAMARTRRAHWKAPGVLPASILRRRT
eukprot:scaffold568_cov376-Prasinococcus_capsulatus_cf.AAC.15